MKITKFIATITLLTIGTVSCTSCAKKVPAPVVVGPSVDAGSDAQTPVDAAVPGPMVIKENKWEFTLPSSDWKKMDGAPEHTVAFVNESAKNIVLMVNEPFTGSFDEYALTALRSVRAAGAVIASAKQVEVNGHNFVLVESSKNNTRVWMWVSVLDGQGYAFSCGGADDAAQQALCLSVAGTLKIN